MTRRRRAAALLLLTGIVVTLLPLPAVAQRVQSSVVLVRQDDVITEDLYAAGNTIIVAGVIEGDLIAVAFDAIRIEGVVEGDVVAISDRIEITGRVDGSVRVGGRNVLIDGEIGGDLFVGGLTVQSGASSEIGRDALVWARSAELLGRVERRVEGTQARIRIGGTIMGGVDITSRAVTLLPGLRVEGDFVYSSDREATVAETATVDGNVTRATALPPNLRVRGIRLLARFVGILGALGLGLAILWAIPNRALGAATALTRRPLASLAWGVGVASVPLAILIVTAGIVAVTSLSSSGPLVLVFLPLALAVASVVLLGLLTAPVPLSLAVGARLRPEWSSYACFLVGFPVLVVVWLLPWVGAFLVLVMALAGLGAWLVADEPAETPASGHP
jgi:cytoskeletal protein CcmA (bactofilin family)